MRPVISILALAMAGCSLLGLEHNDPAPVVPQGEPEAILVVDLDSTADGSAISVEESIRLHLGDEALEVRGALFIDDVYGTAWLCDSVIPAGPAPQPSCGRPALQLQHPNAGGFQVREVITDLIEAGQVGELQQVEGVRWAEDATFFGSITEPTADPG